jgi:hypothetical protein
MHAATRREVLRLIVLTERHCGRLALPAHPGLRRGVVPVTA